MGKARKLAKGAAGLHVTDADILQAAEEAVTVPGDSGVPAHAGYGGLFNVANRAINVTSLVPSSTATSEMDAGMPPWPIWESTS